MRKVLRRVGALPLLALAAALFALLTRLSPDAVERWYMQGFYLRVAPRLAALTAHRGSALIGTILSALPYALVVLGVACLAFCLARRSFGPLWRTLSGALRAGCALFIAFCVLWAPCYSRVSLEQRLALAQSQTTSIRLDALCRRLMREAEQARALVPTDAGGVVCLPYTREHALSHVPEALAAASAVLPDLTGDYPPPKPMPYAQRMGEWGIAGMFMPFTFEALVNLTDMDIQIPFTACHEAAHQRGYAREEDANFIAWLACTRSEDAAFRYSGWLTALRQSMQALYRADNAAWQFAWLALPDGVQDDLLAQRAFYNTEPSSARSTQRAFNDVFLRVNGQAEGADSYGKLVELLLSYYAVPEGDAFAFGMP